MSMTKRVSAPKKTDKKTRTVSIEYVQSKFHRVVFVGGAHGAPAPSAEMIAMSLYNERIATPRPETFEMTDQGGLGRRITEVKDCAMVIREVEVTAMLDASTVRSLRDWLSEQLAKLEGLAKVRRSATDGETE